MKRFSVKVNGQVYDVEVTELKSGESAPAAAYTAPAYSHGAGSGSCGSAGNRDCAPAANNIQGSDGKTSFRSGRKNYEAGSGRQE